MKFEEYKASIDIDKYIAQYVNVEEFLECCKQCDGYSKKWSCPEFDFNPIDYWKKFSTLEIYGRKIYLNEEESKDWRKVLDDIKIEMAYELFDKEKEIEGSVSLSAGSCSFCPEGQCTRPLGEPCIYPEKLRYSIEALGGNVGLTTEKLLGIKILWMTEGKMPEYFVLIGGMLIP